MSKQVIHIEEFRLKVRLGCREEERAHYQVVLVNLSLTSSVSKAAHTDEILDAINYVEVVAEIEKMAETRIWNLVEAMEVMVARELFENFPAIQNISLRVRKNVFNQVQGVSVELDISRDELKQFPSAS